MSNVLDFYANFFKGWDNAQLGPKPTAKEIEIIFKLGARHGKQLLANAMGLRKMGVTGAQIVMACGAPQLNKMRGFISDGLLKRELVPQDAKGHTVYKLTLTPKGSAKIKGTAVAAKPAKKPVKKTPKPVVQEPAEVAQISA